jgi:hypothetical protein
VVRAPSKSAKLCGRENSYTHKSAPKAVPLPPCPTTVPLANRPLRTGAVDEGAAWRPRRQAAFPIVTMEVISDDEEVGQLVPLKFEFFVDFR